MTLAFWLRQLVSTNFPPALANNALKRCGRKLWAQPLLKLLCALLSVLRGPLLEDFRRGAPAGVVACEGVALLTGQDACIYFPNTIEDAS